MTAKIFLESKENSSFTNLRLGETSNFNNFFSDNI